ncbi:uncharacterized protein LOC127856026 isoform X3 [Dreissena polymorpha]|uniref:uncharacterized protein LOC127856026 isoform X1 n=1 Tax=Dreissena polymorpha TaxID=45954 RepID=UPI002264A79E|nr:uncharacterized protein LOC127856026 isoform X1 [Dreissena polymorpha]XP_052247965.1 uncharacterized protein LOC127856026 isoform X2 [Dreissena polymorpha]XP_052247966.1 uncharacterized protein LOC127856026 isoform X3 [Dreissena polymorpha]
MTRPAWVPSRLAERHLEGHYAGVVTRGQAREIDTRPRNRLRSRLSIRRPDTQPRQPLPVQQHWTTTQRMLHRMNDRRPARNVEHESMVLRNRAIPSQFHTRGNDVANTGSRPRNQPKIKRLVRRNASDMNCAARMRTRSFAISFGSVRSSRSNTTRMKCVKRSNQGTSAYDHPSTSRQGTVTTSRVMTSLQTLPGPSGSQGPAVENAERRPYWRPDLDRAGSSSTSHESLHSENHSDAFNRNLVASVGRNREFGRESARFVRTTRVVPEEVRARNRNQTRQTRAEARFRARNLSYEADDEASENEDIENGSEVIARAARERGHQTRRMRTRFARRH